MGDFPNGMTLFGVGLILGGLALLAGAVFGGRRGIRSSRDRSIAWRALDHPEAIRVNGNRAPRRPEIARSALLADTVLLHQIISPRHPDVLPIPAPIRRPTPR